jgi:hypothetical protein
MHGKRNHSTGLWTVPLDTNSTKQNESINSVYEISKVYNTIQYLHAAAGSPVPSPFVKAIKAGNFTTWPTLTPEHVNKYLKKSEATVKGHLIQTRKNVTSTKPKKKHNTREETQDSESHITSKIAANFFIFCTLSVPGCLNSVIGVGVAKAFVRSNASIVAASALESPGTLQCGKNSTVSIIRSCPVVEQ